MRTLQATRKESQMTSSYPKHIDTDWATRYLYNEGFKLACQREKLAPKAGPIISAGYERGLLALTGY